MSVCRPAALTVAVVHVAALFAARCFWSIAETKAQKALAAQKSNKGKKKKWSKHTVKEKANNAVVLSKAQLDKILGESSKYKCITPAVLVDRLKVNASVARRLISLMESKGLIKEVVHHNSCLIYTRATAGPA